MAESLPGIVSCARRIIAAVLTEKHWDSELDELDDRSYKVWEVFNKLKKEGKLSAYPKTLCGTPAPGLARLGVNGWNTHSREAVASCE